MRTSEKMQSKIVVVTGASAGLGRSTAREFAKRGAKLALLARGEVGLQAAKKEVEQIGAEVLALTVDVSDYDALMAAAKEIEQTFGSIDIWVNNAMVSVLAPFKDMVIEDFKRVTEVTYLGYVYGTKIALDSMLPRNKGHIIQVGSALAHRSIPLQSAYCGAKHAIFGFSESIRTELIHDKSRVEITVVEMPALNTPQFEWVKTSMSRHPQPVPPIFQPEVGARAIVHAARYPKKQYWVGFSTFKAIVGQKLASSFADHILAKIGYESQQVKNMPIEENRPNNLWTPVSIDFGCHGIFDHSSKSKSWYWRIVSHRKRLIWSVGFILMISIVSFSL